VTELVHTPAGIYVSSIGHPREKKREVEVKRQREGKKGKTKKGRKCRTRERTRTDKCLKGAPLPRDPKKGTRRYPGMRGVRYAVRKFLGIKSDQRGFSFARTQAE